MRVDFLADDQIAHILRDRKLRDFFGVFGLVIDAVGRAEQNRFHADGAFDQALRQVEFPTNLRLGDFVEIRMRVGVVADFVAVGVFALQDFGIFAGLYADHEKCGGNVFLFEDVEDLRRPARVGAIVKRDRQFLFGRADLVDVVGKRDRFVIFVGEKIGGGVVGEACACRVSACRRNARRRRRLRESGLDQAGCR